jgi:DNA-directed RNA polymerase specialized sigma24 family protein
VTGSITNCLRDLRHAASEAERERARTELWHRAYEHLIHLAQNVVVREDAEEVASDALGKFFRKAQEGAFPRLEGRQDFWALLHAITRNQALNRRRDNSAERRGGQWGKVGGAALEHQAAPEGLPAGAPCVEDSEEVWAFLQFLVDLGRDAVLRDLAYLKYYEGREPSLICRELGVSQATYYRKHNQVLNAVALFEEKLRRPLDE